MEAPLLESGQIKTHQRGYGVLPGSPSVLFWMEFLASDTAPRLVRTSPLSNLIPRISFTRATLERFSFFQHRAELTN